MLNSESDSYLDEVNRAALDSTYCNRHNKGKGLWKHECPDCKQEKEEFPTELIDKVIRLGYGYAKFARSVVKQGKCSIKQKQTMQAMLDRVNNFKPRKQWRKKYYNWDIDTDITSGEIMSFGLEI